ncbi:mechanosensitive ion channel family protein [Dyella sp. C9]|uniref:mechanosensitive ion channel family protein n=1 Tax=Dyella sp. C9 TaxID=2202154 RepID=UPI0013007E22|nr:mechanosensitive ion channel family protein [Dyella sp. C9]
MPAQDEATPAPATAAETPQQATVRFYNRDIVTFRSDFLGRSPELRAKSAEDNIGRIAAQQGDAPVTFKDAPQGTLILLGGELVAILTPDDLDKLNSESMADVRERIAHNLSEAVAASNAANSPRRLLQGILLTLLATLVALGLALALRWSSRRIDGGLHRWLERRLVALRHESARQLALSTRTIATWIVRVITWIIALAILEEWLRFVLGQFPYTQPWSAAMRGWVIRELGHWGSAIASAIPGLVAAVVILLVARAVTQAISMTFRGVQSGRFKLFEIDSELAEPTRKLIVVVVWLFAIAMAYPYLPGAQTEAFKGLSVLVGLMVSLGASGIVGQAASSFTIIYSRTMKVGDLIRSGDTEGVVLQIGLFTTRIRTLTGVEVSIPNNVVLGSQLHNFSRHPQGPGMWLETCVTIGYDTPWRQVQQMLLSAAGETALIERDPAPFVLQTALSDFYVEYRLRVRITDVSRRLDVLSELHSRIQDNFNTSGVQIMSPHYVTDPAEPKVVAPGHWNG